MKAGPFPVPPAWRKNTKQEHQSAIHARSSFISSMSAVAGPGRGSGIATTTIPRPPPSTGGSGGTTPRRPGRLQQCLARIPLCTTLVTILCLALQLCVVLLHWDIGQYAISPAAVLEGACV